MSKKFETTPQEIETTQNISENLSTVSDNAAQIWIEKLRIELAKLGLKIIEDLDQKRVAKPEETYNSLVNLYNAVKENNK